MRKGALPCLIIFNKVLVVFDERLNVLFFSWHGEALSARCYRMDSQA